MAGLLNGKSRVLDTIVTLEGRRQLADGGLDVSYVTFTDCATFYKGDIASGSADATARVYLESCNLPQDAITFQANEDGQLMSELGTFAGHVEQLRTGSVDSMVSLSGSSLHGFFESVLAPSALQNFSRLQAISTVDPIFSDDGFALGNEVIQFTVTNDRPLSDRSMFTANINHLEDIFADPRMSTVTNFKFLPPINRVDDVSVDIENTSAVSDRTLGSYVPWGIGKIDYETVDLEHRHYADLGFMRTVNFDPTSRDNRLFMQAFEVGNNSLLKLDVIDFGSHNLVAEHGGSTFRTFFVGKLMTKPETQTHAFVHLFTLIFG